MKKKINGTSQRPRLYIFKSNKHIYAQLIDDEKKIIIASSSTISKNLQKLNTPNLFSNCHSAKIVGKDIAQKSKQKGFMQLIFDRGKNIYHGKIKELANAVREEGLII